MNGLRILLTDTKRWAVGVRVGKVFADLGCEVGMLCPAEGHPAHTVRAIRHRYAHRGAAPLRSLRQAIERFRPDLILATCDRGVQHLHRLHARTRAAGEHWIADCIERSIGPAESYPVVSNRYSLLTLARDEGVLIPRTIALETENDLNRAAGLGFPLVIKADGTWGGGGVMVAKNPQEARRAFEALRRRNGIRWLATQMALNCDRGTAYDDWKHTRPALIAQAWVEGQPGNCAVACWNGKVLAGIPVEVLASNGDRGPASVVEVVEGRAMMLAAKRIARRLHLSGFFGLDFMIARDGAAYLIEMNARCTQPCSLELGKGRNLPAAICAALAGVAEPETEPVTELRRIAYFPKQIGLENTGIPEWSYHYDVPVNEPAFVEQLLHQWKDRAVLGRWVDSMRGVVRGRYEPASYSVATDARKAARREADLAPSKLRIETR